jgi:O-antigen ligase
MAGRFALALAVFLVAVNAISSVARLRAVTYVATAAGVFIALLALLEYANADPVLDWLRTFRPNVAHVGAQVRAGGPFQYPTIASMYQEIVFALTLGMLLHALDAGRRTLAALLAMALMLIAQSITLTFTRAGLITMAASLATVGVLRFRERGADRGVAALAGVALMVGAQFASSRSVEALRLRLTTEGQETWYHATIDAPVHVSVQTGGTVLVPLTVTNTGFTSWDSHAASPFRLSYHWLLPDQDRVVSWEGVRTEFPTVVEAGDEIELQAHVVAPRQPGDYRLMWDIEQEHRLWFSTEPDADVYMSRATVTGPAAETIDASQLPGLPLKAVRPGRLVLWRAAASMFAEHPLVGVGPDNFRLEYGRYAGLRGADRRVHSNNMYFEVLTGSGLLGGLAFTWLFAAAARASIHLRRGTWRTPVAPLAAGIIAASVAVALHGLVDSFLSFTATYTLIAITLGLIVAVRTLHERSGVIPSGNERNGEEHAHRV